MAKTNAENCKNYYNRKKAAKAAGRQQGVLVKTGAERARAYRLRKKSLVQGNQSSKNEIVLTTSDVQMCSESLSQPITTSKKLNNLDVAMVSGEIADHVGDNLHNSSSIINDNRKYITVKSEASKIEYINIKEEYCIDEDENNVRATEDEEEVDESTLNMNVNAWPVNIHFEMARETVDSIIDVNDDDKMSKNENSDSYQDSTGGEDSSPSSPSSVENNSSDVSVDVDSRKRKKVLKMRRKPKRQLSSQLKCNECSVQCNTQTEMSMHLYTVHNIDNHYYLNNKFVCRLCKITFISKLYLETHINEMHTEKRVINCIKCNKVFKYRSYLTGNITNSATARYKKFTCFHCSLKRV